MLQPRRELDLAQEPLGAQAVGQLGAQHLERDRPVVPEVPGEVDRRHPAAAELALERVAAGQCGLRAARGRERSSGGPAQSFPTGLNENFCPPTDASYISPPFAIVTMATPFR